MGHDFVGQLDGDVGFGKDAPWPPAWLCWRPCLKRLEAEPGSFAATPGHGGRVMAGKRSVMLR